MVTTTSQRGGSVPASTPSPRERGTSRSRPRSSRTEPRERGKPAIQLREGDRVRSPTIGVFEVLGIYADTGLEIGQREACQRRYCWVTDVPLEIAAFHLASGRWRLVSSSIAPIMPPEPRPTRTPTRTPKRRSRKAS